MKRTGLTLLIAVCLLAGAFRPVASQAGARVLLSGLNTDSFPLISFFLDPVDAQGAFVDGLTPQALGVVENGTLLPADSLEVVEPGLELILAWSPSGSMSANLGDASQFETVRRALLDWMSRQKEGAGRFSFVTDGGSLQVHAALVQQWADMLTGYQPNLAAAQPSLTALVEAVRVSADPPVSPQSKRAILWVTPPLDEKTAAGLSNLTAQAQQIGVRVFIWVLPPAGAAAPDTALLQALADQTQGRLAVLSEPGAIPDLENWLAPLRRLYRVIYTSRVQAGGSQSVTVQSDSPALQGALIGELAFSLDLQPPNPIFLSPPASVQRTWTEGTRAEPARLQPDSQPLAILVEFPDGRTRPLRAARLFVNGELAAENRAAPFETFAWDLRAVETGGQAVLRVEVEDSFGLTGASSDLAVEVVVQPKPDTSLLARISPTGLIAFGAVLAAAGALAIVLIGENRLRARRRAREQRRLSADPLTQPVPGGGEKRRGPARRETAAKPRPTVPPARLVPLADNDQPAGGGQVPIARSETVIGSDPRQSILAVEDPSVDPIHARLVRRNGSFILFDEGSVAGTWVNYTPVGSDGVELCHGDEIRFGRAAYRFDLVSAPEPPAPQVEVLEEPL